MQEYFQVSNKSIDELFKKFRPFHIPTYQRPYSWGEDECQQLWEDLQDFFIKKAPYKCAGSPNPPRYFLGSVVAFHDEKNGNVPQYDVIDGQQRITTLMLLLKVFYDDLNDHTQRGSKDQEREAKILERLESVLWTVEWSDSAGDNGDNVFNINKPILSSEAIEDATGVRDFRKIMAEVPAACIGCKRSKHNTRYVENYLILKDDVESAFTRGELRQSAKWRFVETILDYCVMLFIDCAEPQAALKIFNTLNNRGMQLRDADILKSYLFKEYEKGDKREEFRRDWASFSYLAAETAPLKPDKTPAQDEMFRFLMMWSKARNNNAENDIALREYFEDGSAGKSEMTVTVLRDKLIPLAALFAVIARRVKKVDNDVDDGADVESREMLYDAEFVGSINDEVSSLLTQTAVKFMQVLACFNKNAYWRHLLAVFYLKHRGEEGLATKLELFIRKVTAFNIAYILYDVPFTHIRRKTYNLLCEIYRDGDFATDHILEWSPTEIIHLGEDAFSERLDAVRLKSPFSRAMTLLHAYLNHNQDSLIPVEAEVEHVFPRSWEKNIPMVDRERGICGVTAADMDAKIYENFGNKVMLEKVQNILASDGYFDLKACIYQGNCYKKGPVSVADDGTRTQPQFKNSIRHPKCPESEIADVHAIWKAKRWGKEEILERDRLVKRDLFDFFKQNLLSANGDPSQKSFAVSDEEAEKQHSTAPLEEDDASSVNVIPKTSGIPRENDELPTEILSRYFTNEMSALIFADRNIVPTPRNILNLSVLEVKTKVRGFGVNKAKKLEELQQKCRSGAIWNSDCNIGEIVRDCDVRVVAEDYNSFEDYVLAGVKKIVPNNSLLTDKQVAILRFRLGWLTSDEAKLLTLEEIASSFGCTRQAVQLTEEKMRSYLTQGQIRNAFGDLLKLGEECFVSSEPKFIVSRGALRDFIADRNKLWTQSINENAVVRLLCDSGMDIDQRFEDKFVLRSKEVKERYERFTCMLMDESVPIERCEKNVLIDGSGLDVNGILSCSEEYEIFATWLIDSIPGLHKQTQRQRHVKRFLESRISTMLNNYKDSAKRRRFLVAQVLRNSGDGGMDFESLRRAVASLDSRIDFGERAIDGDLFRKDDLDGSGCYLVRSGKGKYSLSTCCEKN